MAKKDYQPITQAQSIKNLEYELRLRKKLCIKKIQNSVDDYLTHCKVMRTETTKTDFDEIDNLIISFDQELLVLLENLSKK